MHKAIPWGVRGSGEVNIREAARNAARRERMSLNEWFAQAVGEYAARLGIDPADLDEADHAEAVAAKLHRLTAQDARRAAAVRARPKPRLARADDMPSRGMRSRSRDAAAEDGLLERAFAWLEHNDDKDSLEAPAPRRARMETDVPPRRRSVEPELPPRRARVEPEAPLRQSAAARPSLGNAIAEITRHQRALEEAAVGAAARIHAREPDVAPRSYAREPDVSARSYAAREPDMATMADTLAGSATLETLRGDIAVLANQIQGLRRDQAEHNALPPPTCNLDKLRGEIATMSEALRELAARGSTAPLEAAIRNLTQQIEASRSDGIRETVLQPLERLVGDLRLALAEADPRTTFRGLENEVKKLGTKLDSIGRIGFDPSALNVIDTRTREIRDILSADVFQSAPVERIGRQLEALTERVDYLRDAPRLEAVRQDSDLSAVANELRLLTGERGASAFAKIEDQLAAITAKVDEALAEARDETRYTALANRINDVHLELAERLAQAAPQLDMRALESLVRGLADKIDAVRAPEADNRAIEALQRQVSEFAARLDRTDTSVPVLASLEHSIGELFAELERTRDSSFAAAERAARHVLDEALNRKGIAPEPQAFEHDLIELRSMQDEAGRRTMATLNAVHETLERVVDRLATVETEIADVRTQRPADLLASGPAPNFAPASGRAREPFVASRAQMRPELATVGAVNSDLGPDEDFLIEPGRGFPRGRDRADDNDAGNRPAASNSFDAPEASSGRAGFIAAARRAAQAAQMESDPSISRPALSTEGTAGLVEQTRTFINNHKRPVVLSVAALFLAMGAYAVVKAVVHPPIDSRGSQADPTGQVPPAHAPALAAHGPSRSLRAARRAALLTGCSSSLRLSNAHGRVLDARHRSDHDESLRAKPAQAEAAPAPASAAALAAEAHPDVELQSAAQPASRRGWKRRNMKLADR